MMDGAGKGDIPGDPRNGVLCSNVTWEILAYFNPWIFSRNASTVQGGSYNIEASTVEHDKAGTKFKYHLLPSGHAPGARSFHLVDNDGRNAKSPFLYTGDFSTEAGRLFPPLLPRRCNTIACECTFGLPMHVFPPIEEIKKETRDWIEDALKKGPVVLYGYPLGKNQEILAMLDVFSESVPIIVDETTYFINGVHEKHGKPLPAHESYRGYARKRKFWRESDWILLLPMHDRFKERYKKFDSMYCSKAVFSGKVADTAWLDGLRVEKGICLSGHPDFPSLVTFIEACEPEVVLLTHGNGMFLKRHLSRRMKTSLEGYLPRDVKIHPLL
jgi:hypothetical protein